MDEDRKNVFQLFPKQTMAAPQIEVPTLTLQTSPGVTVAEGGFVLAANPVKDVDEESRRAIVDNVCMVYFSEIYYKLSAMGYNVHTEEFDKDIEFAQEALHSALLRTFEIYHPIQDYVDENFDLVSIEDFNKMNLSGSANTK